MTFGRRAVDRGGLALVGLVVLLMAAPSSLGAGPFEPRSESSAAAAVSPSAVAPDAAAVYSGSFAARAGYDNIVLSAVSPVAPAIGSELVVVTFRPNDPSFFSPPTGGQSLSVGEIANRYGLSAAAYASAESYFESMGLRVVHAWGDRLELTVGGSAAAVGRAFGTELASGTYEGRKVTYPASPPSLPASLESSVASVTGLSNGFVRFAQPAGIPTALGNASAGPAGPSYDLITPGIAREIYDFPALYNVSGSPRYATDQTIALILWGDGYDPNDLSTFFANDYPSSFPRPTIRPFPLDGAPMPYPTALNDPSKAPQELTLDVEWAGSMAPGATLDAVYVPDGPSDQGYSPSVATITDALTEAVTAIPNVSTISMSFGTPEDSSQPLAAAWATDLATATQEGITLLAATGDLGGVSGTLCTGTPITDFPADSPDVLAVGGTAPALARNILGQVTGLASEPAWIGSGGGFSTRTPAPSWQEVGSAAGPIRSNGHRGIPDVSAASAYNFLYYDNQNSVAAGTSFATPLWAGLIAEMDALYGSPFGFLTPRLYSVGAAQESGKDPVALADITSGSNCATNTLQGWDSVTGWGSPRALLLYEDLTATFVHLSISATPTTVAPGGTVTVVAQLTNRTSGSPLFGVPVEVRLAASSSNGPCAGVWGSGSPTSNATGFVRLTVTIPSCFLGAHGTSDVTVTTDGYYGVNSTSFDINLLGFFPALVGIERYPNNVIAFGVMMGAAVAVGYVLGRGPRRASPPAPGPPPSPPAARPPPAPSKAAGNPPAAPAPAPPPSSPPTPASPPPTGGPSAPPPS